MITLTLRTHYVDVNHQRHFIYVATGDEASLSALIARAMTFGRLSLNEKNMLKDEHKLFVSERTAQVWRNRTTVQVSDLWPSLIRRRKSSPSSPTFSL